MTQKGALALAGLIGVLGMAAGMVLWRTVGAELWLAGSLPFCG